MNDSNNLNKYYRTRQNILQVFRDPLSGYKFVLDYPFHLKNKWAIHPAYNEDFSTSYKNAKEILISNEHLYNLETKRLVFGILLYHLSQKKILGFNQFKELSISYAFFGDKKFLAKFFFILPKLWRMPAHSLKRYPRFRVSGDDIYGIKFWIDLCIQHFNKIEQNQAENTYDEKFLQMSAVYSRWKIGSNKLHKLPKKLIKYIYTCSQIPKHLHETYESFFTLSAGELWIQYKSRSSESVDSFWNLLECIDHIELSDYQNDITRFASQWLKLKANEWTSWEPSFDDLLLDHKLSYKKKAALVNLYKTWEKEDEEKSLEKFHMNAAKKSIEERLKTIRQAQNKDKKTAQSFTVVSAKQVGDI